jgi:ferric enterobactin receptor
VRINLSQILTVLMVALLTLPARTAGAQGPPPPPAAQPSFEIRGQIVDTANVPIPHASVSLRTSGSTATIAGAIANTNGSFRITGLRPGTFTIRVAFIGYSPVIQQITIAPNTPVLDLGVAKLAPLALQLDAVMVEEARAAMTVEPDRNSYRANDLAPGAATASELLENVPSVHVDMDGKVSLRGNENVVVQINGRPTPMQGAQLAAYLQGLPANMVDRIEVIPNPSARYDPEGMAGIINVALKSNVDLGLSGAVNGQMSSIDRYNSSGNVGYHSGPWTAFVSGGMIAGMRNEIGINNRDRYNSASVLLNSTEQDLLLAPRFAAQNLNATVDYKLSARDVLSNALMLGRRGSANASSTTYTFRDGSGEPLDQFMRPRDTDVTGLTIDYDVALKRSFAQRTHELGGGLRFTHSGDDNRGEERRLTDGGYSEGRIERNDLRNRQFAGHVDYLKELRPGTKVETGWKSTARWLDRDYTVITDPTGSGSWAPSPLSNNLGFDEAVHAIYAVVSQRVKSVDLQAGLRGEQANRTFSLETQNYPYSYGSLFPSAVASYSLDPRTQLKASYSRRIRRPGTNELNPFPTYFDADNVFLGNPALEPEYTGSWELGFTRTGAKGMLQLTPFFRQTSNVIRIDINPTDTIADREVTSISFRNLAKSNSWGSDLNGQLRLSPRFTALTNFSVFKLVTDGGSTSAVGSDALGWSASFNVTSELTKTLSVQGMFNYRAPMKIERGEFGAQQMANFTLRRKIQGNNGAVMLRVADPFEMMRFRISTGDGTIMQLTERDPRSRMFFLGYQYNFGRKPQVRQVAPEETGGGSVGFGPPAGE